MLGVIPQKVRPLIEEGPDSPHAEAYRVLRTNMQFANKGVTGGAFAVVSGGVGEGKSTTLFNLAYVCAQLGDKVLIVDSDLRRPVQHKILGMSNRFGLTNVLMRDVPIEEAIKTDERAQPAFPAQRQAAALRRSGLLDSQRMRELVKNLKARYDYVFFDSPPIMGVTDASILASEVDGVLLVVQYRKYPRIISLARQAHDRERRRQPPGRGAEQHQHPARRLLLLLSLLLLALRPVGGIPAGGTRFAGALQEGRALIRKPDRETLGAPHSLGFVHRRERLRPLARENGDGRGAAGGRDAASAASVPAPQARRLRPFRHRPRPAPPMFTAAGGVTSGPPVSAPGGSKGPPAAGPCVSDVSTG